MKRKLAIVFMAFVIFAMLIAPVLAKTKYEIYVEQPGQVDFASADKSLDTPNDRVHHLWNADGTGTAFLYEADKVTVIDTFASSSEVDIKGKDSMTLGFIDGVLVMHLNMLWESNTYQDSGFAGIAQWRATADTPHEVTINAVYQGFGHYHGQTLQLSGTWTPATQILSGTLLS
jgi:hypothetical protein